VALAPPATPAQPAEAPLPAPVPPISAALLYARAENALRVGRPLEARDDLDLLVKRFPDSELAPVALYELTLMAIRAHDLPEARRRAEALARVATDGALKVRARALLEEIGPRAGEDRR
jgi:predicted Zn-dependent protease